MSAPKQEKKTSEAGNKSGETVAAPESGRKFSSGSTRLGFVMLVALVIWGTVIGSVTLTVGAVFGMVLAMVLAGRAMHALPGCASWSDAQKDHWVLAMGFLGAVITMACFQPLRPNPFATTEKVMSFDNWRWPVEHHAFLRSTNPATGLRSITVADDENLWAVGGGGVILHSSDAGANWERVAPTSTNDWTEIQFADDENGLIIGTGATMLLTTNGGATWMPSESAAQHGSPSAFYAMAMADASNWHVVGSRGLILSSVDAGRNWTRYSTYKEDRIPAEIQSLDLRAVHFINTQIGWTVGDHGVTLHTTNGGARWQFLGYATNVDAFVSVTRQGQSTVVTPASKGVANARGNVVQNALNVMPAPLTPRRQTNLFAISSNGQLWRRADGPNQDWQLNPHQPQEAPASLTQLTGFANGSGWAVARNGAIFFTTDGWQQSSRVTVQGRTGTNAPLRMATFTTASNGWAVGGHTILSTGDGKVWSELPRAHRAWPAPWFWVASGLALAWTAALWLAFPPGQRRVVSALDNAVSDAPIRRIGEDKLNFREIALGLSRFIRNPNTRPPLTLAISGDWGTGKSSILNLLRRDLEQHHFPTVWFNAWHQQNEEQIFGALLQSVVQQAVPSFTHPSGWAFRTRLYLGRIRQHPWRLAGSLIAIALVCGAFAFFLQLHNTQEPGLKRKAAPVVTTNATEVVTNVAPVTYMEVKAPATNATELVELLRGGFRVEWRQPPAANHAGETAQLSLWRPADWLGILEHLDQLPQIAARDLPKGSGLIGIIISGLGSLSVLWRLFDRARAFGVNPATALTKARAGMKLSDLENKASFQLRFAEQFREVTEAMGLRQLVIFIDDLDRCQPEKVTQMLEAINFLVASGKCFVVLGFARSQVEAAVGLGFERMAFEMQLDGPQRNGEPDGEFARRCRRKFAQFYLKKLINLEVKVPDLQRGLISNLLSTPPESEAVSPGNASNQMPNQSSTANATTAAAWIALIGLNLLLAATSAHAELPPSKFPPEQYAKTPIPAAPQPIPEAPMIAEKSYQWWWLIVPVGPALCLLWLASRRPPLHEAEDPPSFCDALNIWAPLIWRRHRTPRELKRYVNRVRFIMSSSRVDDGHGAAPQPAGQPTIGPEFVVYFSAEELFAIESADGGGHAEWGLCQKDHQQRFREPAPTGSKEFYEKIASRLASD